MIKWYGNDFLQITKFMELTCNFGYWVRCRRGAVWLIATIIIAMYTVVFLPIPHSLGWLVRHTWPDVALVVRPRGSPTKESEGGRASLSERRAPLTRYDCTKRPTRIQLIVRVQFVHPLARSHGPVMMSLWLAPKMWDPGWKSITSSNWAGSPVLMGRSETKFSEVVAKR